MNQPRAYVPPSDSVPIPTFPIRTLGETMPFSFTTMEGLVGHFTQWLPHQYVVALIENEKEVFVVRRDCSLQETRLQFLKKCENTLVRTIQEIQSGRSTLDWGAGSPAGQ